MRLTSAKACGFTKRGVVMGIDKAVMLGMNAFSMCWLTFNGSILCMGQQLICRHRQKTSLAITTKFGKI